VRVGFDATPLLGHRTGIGVYVDRLLNSLLSIDEAPSVVATAFTFRGRDALDAALPAGVERRARGIPQRLLSEAWQRGQFPVEWLCGPVDVFHGTNFVLPPLRRARGVVNVHDLSFLHSAQTVSANSLRYRALVPQSIQRAQVVCTLSQAMADEIVAEYDIPTAQLVVAPPGVDAAWFDARPDPAVRTRLGLPERYILAVGTLEPRKNLPLLVACYRELRRSDPTTPPLVLAGPPGWGPALELDSLPPGSVFTTGYLSDVDLRAVVAGAAVLCFPSLYEGFGLPPVEALACGVAVIASDLTVTREVLGAAATLVPVGDGDALSEALRGELDQGSTAEAVATRRAQAAKWTWSYCATQTIAAYTAALR
jgi:glycosyltransferase involved in cell wall biosynthesis